MPGDTGNGADAVGPLAYRNWIAMRRSLAGEPDCGYEVLLFGDAPVIGGHWLVGPYEILNTISGVPKMVGATVPPVALRIWEYLGQGEYFPPLTDTDVSSYTGTDQADEIAVLLALLTARRFRAGGMARRFGSRADPGMPCADAGIAPPVVPPRGRRVLPRQAGDCVLLDEQRDLLASYVDLPADRAVALARAARAYRDALWVGESQPELAWLLLVSAVECAANAVTRTANDDPVARLRASRSKLAKKLTRAIPEADLPGIAKELAPLFKATEKFITFLLRFGPTAGPEPRPAHGAFRWGDEGAMRAALELVYEHRSNALHEAIAIPVPMLQPPRRWEGAGFDEVPGGLAAGALGAAWTCEDTPMLLHTFEFAVQHALVAWWRSQRASTASGPVPPGTPATE